MRRHSSKGQSLVETSLILAGFMGLLVGMTGVGQALFVRQTLADRAHNAARWGAVNPYDQQSIRNLVRYGVTTPADGASPFAGLAPSEVVVGNPGCPGPNCRVSVEIPGQGIRSVEPVEGLF
ncbi:MAG TPA: TadE family protein [Bryobacteraceae bacterium]|nr:TadE family protein [Bryobacteraceae bacterium]